MPGQTDTHDTQSQKARESLPCALDITTPHSVSALRSVKLVTLSITAQCQERVTASSKPPSVLQVARGLLD